MPSHPQDKRAGEPVSNRREYTREYMRHYRKHGPKGRTPKKIEVKKPRKKRQFLPRVKHWVLTLLACGYCRKEIAQLLRCTVKNVEYHAERLHREFHAQTDTQLVLAVLRKSGLIL